MNAWNILNLPKSFRNVIDKALKLKWDRAFKQTPIFYNTQSAGVVLVNQILNFSKGDKAVAKIVVDKIKKQYNVEDGDYDKFMLCLMKFFLRYQDRYTTDTVKFKVREYWQTPSEFYHNNFHGDCDDFAIFMKACSTVFGVPDFRHKLCARTVYNQWGTKQGGHLNALYLTYAQNCWYTIESTYYLHKSIEAFGRIEDSDRIYYNGGKETIWFTFNQENTWAQNSSYVNNHFWRKD